MNNQEEILQKQNDEGMLKCQYAARHYYNTAEIFSIVAFICSMISLLFILAPEKDSPLYSASILLVPLALDAVSLISYWRMGVSVSSAALLRNYFDEKVLGINSASYTDHVTRKVKSLIINASEKSQAECEIQISNTGRDNPPGVKNWYEFSHQYSDDDAVFECQKQNCWWNNALCHRRLLIYGAVLLSGVFLGIIINLSLHVSVLRIIVCLLSAIVTFADRFCENCKYIRLSMKIDDRCEALEVSKNQVLISSLQVLISKRRELRVVEINRIHKKHSKALSERYEQITKES